MMHEDLEQRSGPELAQGSKGGESTPIPEDRYDNDGGEETFEPTSLHSEYAARLDRRWKYALWRTEMVQRLRSFTDDAASTQGSF